ncbi:MAG: SGNH/GDSL hydrolase family protein [Polyangiaceae bacterium]
MMSFSRYFKTSELVGRRGPLSLVLVSGLLVALACSSSDPVTPGNDASTTKDTGTSGSSGGDDAQVDAGEDVVIPTEPEIQFFGRVDLTDPAQPRFSWPGAKVLANFKGTSVKASFRETPTPEAQGTGVTTYSQYNVIIDGVQTKVLKLPLGASADVELATGLPDGDHQIILERRTEAAIGSTQFLGFDFGEGKLAIPPPRPTKKIELIGDSITVGWGADFKGPYDGNEPPHPENPYNEGEECAPLGNEMPPAAQKRQDAQNNSVTYGQLIAKHFGAEAHVVAWSGRGAARNLNDLVAPTVPEMYDRAFAGSSSPKWDFTKWSADVVIVNLGTNDFVKDNNPPNFTAKYEAFIGQIRQNYPNAWIYCLNGPMLTYYDDPGVPGLSPRMEAEKAIKGTVDKLIGAGDTKIRYLNIDQDYQNFGCEFHPYKASHATIAAAIEQEIKVDVKWKTVNP